MNNHSTTIWDLPTRLFHWLIVAHAISLWILSGEQFSDQWHPILGKSILSLALFRVVWGVIGSEHSRWQNMPFSLKSLWLYLTLKQTNWPGHSPAGAYFTIIILLLIIVQSGSGLMHTDDMFFDGPLRAHTSEKLIPFIGLIHANAFDIGVGLIAIHIIMIALYQFVKGQALYRSMITGKKEYLAAAPAQPASNWLALLIAIIVYSIVFYGLDLIPQPIQYFGF